VNQEKDVEAYKKITKIL